MPFLRPLYLIYTGVCLLAVADFLVSHACGAYKRFLMLAELDFRNVKLLNFINDYLAFAWFNQMFGKDLLCFTEFEKVQSVFFWL